MFALNIIALLIALSTCIAIISFYCSDPFFYRVACSQKISYRYKKTILLLQRKAYNPLFLFWLFNRALKRIKDTRTDTKDEEATRLDSFVFACALQIVMRVHICTYFYICIPLLLVLLFIVVCLFILGRITMMKDWMSNLMQRPFLHGIMASNS